MSVLNTLTLVLVGLTAGAAGSIVGAAGLVTMTALLALGVPPVTANASNIVALIPGGVTGLYGYRRHLPRDQGLLVRITAAAVCGAALGGALLLAIPAAWFKQIIPLVVLASSAFLAVQPLLARRRATETASAATGSIAMPETDAVTGTLRLAARPTLSARVSPRPRLLLAAATASGVYGGWLSVSLGTVITGLVGASLPDAGVHRLNALRLWLSLVIGVTASTMFMASGLASWTIIAPVGLGTLAGGWIGAVAGRRLNPALLRGLIVAAGVLSAITVIAS